MEKSALIGPPTQGDSSSLHSNSNQLESTKEITETDAQRLPHGPSNSVNEEILESMLATYIIMIKSCQPFT